MSWRPATSLVDFRKDVGRLAAGAGFAQAISLTAAPIISRLYSPDSYGAAGVFTSWVGILAVVACLRYEQATLLPKDERTAAGVLILSLSVSVAASIAIAVTWLAGGWRLVDPAGVLESHSMLIAPAVMAAAFVAATTQWNVRQRRYSLISKARVSSQSVGTFWAAAASIGWGAAAGGLIWGFLASQVTAALLLLGKVMRADRSVLLPLTETARVVGAARRYSDLPLYATSAALLNTASWHLPILLLGNTFTTSVAGHYALGFRVLQMPMILVGAAIGDVLFQRAAEAARRSELPRLLTYVLRRLVLIASLPFLLLSLTAPDLYAIVFGPAWREAGVFTQILAVWSFVWFVSAPFSTLFTLLERQGTALAWNVGLLLSRAGALVAGGLLGSPRAAIAMYAAAGIALYGVHAALVLPPAGLSLKEAWHTTWTAAVHSIPFGLPVVLLKILGVDTKLLILTAVGSAVCYAIYVWQRRLL